MASLLEELRARGLVHQETHAELAKHLEEPRRVYGGFDPSAPSLTVGNLVAIQLLARFQKHGHTPVVIMGGGTGLIGDPSGKSAERPSLSPEEVRRNVEHQRPIFESLLSFEGKNAAILLDNSEWLGKLGFLEVLRDLGKHFSVNMMIQKDSVRERLHGREQGISYTEFSYMLLQAYDFLHLYDEHGVTVQVAGSDQWGNIVAGIDLVRRLRHGQVYGLTAPLITKADGTKFGKTESGAVWLTQARTPPYEFYQFWLNVSDADLEKYLNVFSHFTLEQIASLLGEQARDPASRAAQRALAFHMTALLHGHDQAVQAEKASAVLFSGDVAGLSEALLEQVFGAAPVSQHAMSELEAGVSAVDLLLSAGLAKSKREAREFLSNGAVSINGVTAVPDTRLGRTDLLHQKVLLIRRGKKTWHVTRWS